MNLLTLFGFLAVTAMVICYGLENYNPWFILAFSVSCILASVYAFLQGAWPFAVVEMVWSVVAIRRWWHSRSSAKGDKGKRYDT